MNTLDPSGPHVLDLRALGLQQRAGSMITADRTVPAPGSLGVALATVPVGSPVELELRLESVMEGVLVTGTADIHVDAECARCLDPLEWDEAVDFSELFVYADTDDRAGAVAELGDDEDPLPGIRDDLIDLEPTLRDAVVLGLPLSPVCREECAGLCSECGVRLDSAPGHAHELTDPRWAALAGLVEPDEQ